jgi:eukaryotic-like serine/threonine-protein kinase
MPEAALAPGSTLDRYELLCPLAEGGMATVWLARMQGKRGFEKLVAIKTIRAELVDDPRFEEMFLDEARIASGIAHPNVAQIIDLGEKSGILYLVMEWVDGESLAKIRKFAAKAHVRIPLGLSLRIISDACAGLHAAHELKGSEGTELGVVHRDVSPQNILVSTAGAVKVIDFGIAKAQNRLGTRTRTGIVKGKVQYMAPEQARGEDHDRRVDVWALGVCLYELVSDRLPFDGDNPLEVLSRITSEDPPPIEDVVPSGVRDIIAGALARRPEDRFPTAASLRRSLENALGHLGMNSSTEDVAAFIDAYMPNRAAERREVVAQALRAAESRGVDVFTGTMEVEGVAPTRREGSGGTRSPTSTPHLKARQSRPGVQSRPGMRAFSARALIEEQPKSSTPLWALLLFVVFGLGGYFAWQNQNLLRSLLGRGVTPERTASPTTPSSAGSAAQTPSSEPATTVADAAALSPDLDAAPLEAGATLATPTEPSSGGPSKAHKHGWPHAAHDTPGVQGTPGTPGTPGNTDWLPKESELPKIAPKPPGDAAN